MTCNGDNTFIIHAHMNPWVLIDEHASHIKDPIKNYPLWDTHKHSEWCESLIDMNELIPTIIEDFETEYAEELRNKSIQRIGTIDAPIKSVLYRVNKQ